MRPLIYNNELLIFPKGIGATQKSLGLDGREFIKREAVQFDDFYKKYISLDNAVFIKKKSSRFLEIPFTLNYKLGIFKYHYDLKKGKNYELQVEYQMLKETTEDQVIKSKLDSVIKLGYTPYYKKISSNKVTLAIE